MVISDSTNMHVSPITLEGKVVRLEPLTQNHVADLCEVGFHPSIWEYMLYGNIDSEAGMNEFIQDLLERQEQGTDLPFAVINKSSGKAIGCTRYLDIQPINRCLEIGGTWYGLDYQRTAVNTEAKYLLLSHAFEILGAERVQLKTDLNNVRSQKAIERLGAVREGVLRNHMRRPDGLLRSSVYYSILREEWPEVKKLLASYMGSA